MRNTTALTLLTASACAAALALAPAASAAHGGLTVTGLTANDRLVTFLANAPGQILSEVKVTGVSGDLAAIDFRPANGALYGVGVQDGTGTIYTIVPSTGVATAVPGGPALPLAGEVSIDVNPRADALRIVDSSGTNLRVPFGTLALVPDGPLAYVAGDANDGATPAIGAIAYTNNLAAPATGPTTQLFDLDTSLGSLALQDPPNAGGLKTVGALPQASKAQFSGFDIYQRETARGGNTWAFVSLFHQGSSTFYEIDLATGKAKVFAASPGDPASGTVIGGRPHVTDIALAPNQGV